MVHVDNPGGTPVTLIVPPAVAQPSPTPGVVITPPRPHLPFTGFDAGTALLLAVLLIALGALVLVKGHRAAPTTTRRI
jgi:hypothetical protein